MNSAVNLREASLRLLQMSGAKNYRIGVSKVFIKYEELDRLERDQIKVAGGSVAGNKEDVNNNVILKPAAASKNDVHFATENQMFSRNNLNNNEMPVGRAVPTLRLSGIGTKSGKINATAAPKSNEKQDLMYLNF